MKAWKKWYLIFQSFFIEERHFRQNTEHRSRTFNPLFIEVGMWLSGIAYSMSKLSILFSSSPKEPPTGGEPPPPAFQSSFHRVKAYSNGQRTSRLHFQSSFHRVNHRTIKMTPARAAFNPLFIESLQTLQPVKSPIRLSILFSSRWG